MPQVQLCFGVWRFIPSGEQTGLHPRRGLNAARVNTRLTLALHEEEEI